MTPSLQELSQWLDEPDQAVLGPKVVLEAVCETEPEERAALIDGLWSRLTGTGLALELAEQLDEWAQEHPEGEADALAARTLMRGQAPSALVEAAWLRELQRRGPDAVDWRWFGKWGSTQAMLEAASVGDALDSEGRLVLSSGLLARKRTELFDLIGAIGIEASGLSYGVLDDTFGGAALVALPEPDDDGMLMELLQRRHDGGDETASARTLQILSHRQGPSTHHEMLGAWLIEAGKTKAALKTLSGSVSDQALRLLWDADDFEGVRTRLEGCEERSESQTVFLARALSHLGRQGAKELLEDVPGPEAFRLRVGLALEEGRGDSLAELLQEKRDHGLSDERAWKAFELLAGDHRGLAVPLVLEDLASCPNPELLDVLTEACERDSQRITVLDYLLKHHGTEARWATRLDLSPAEDHAQLLSERARWQKRGENALKDLRAAADAGLDVPALLTLTAQLLVLHPETYELADELVHLGLQTQELDALVAPTLEAARRQSPVGGGRLLARVGNKLVGCGASQQLRRLLAEARVLAPDLPDVISFWAAFEAEDGDVGAARTRLVAAALERPGDRVGESLALLALDYMDFGDPGAISLARLWPTTPRMILAYCEARLRNGEALELDLLSKARQVDASDLKKVWARGLHGDPAELAAIIDLDGSAIDGLVEHALEEEAVGFLRRLASRMDDPERLLQQWAVTAMSGGHQQLAYDLLVGGPGGRSTQESALALQALHEGAEASDDRLLQEGLRALELGIDNEHLISLALRLTDCRELLEPLLRRNPDRIELIALCRDHIPDLLDQFKSKVVAAACCRPGQAVVHIDRVFAEAAETVGRHPLLLGWWAECVPDRESKLLVEAAEANPGPWGAEQLLRAARTEVSEDRAAAITLLQRARVMDPSCVGVLRALADLLRDDRPAEALELIQPLMDHPERDSGDLFRLARLTERTGDLEASARAFEQAGMPSRLDLLQEAIPVFASQGQSELARDWIRELIRQWGEGLSRTELALEYTRLARTELDLGALDVALASARRAIELDESSPEARELLGRVLLESDEHAEEGLQHLEEAARRCPRSRRGQLLAEVGTLTEDAWHRADLLEEARRLGAPLAESQLFCLAEALERTARGDEALETIQIAVDACADEQTRRQYLVWMGDLAFRRLDRLEPALKAWQQALAADPRDEEVLQRVRAACESSGRYAELVDTLHRVIDVEQDPARRHRLWRRIAELSDEHLNRPDLAARAYGEMLQIDDSIPLREQLAARLVAEGKGEEVQRVLFEAWTQKRIGELGAGILCQALELSGRPSQALAVDDVERLRGRSGQPPTDRSRWRKALPEPTALTVTELRSLMPGPLRDDSGQYLAEAWSVVHPLVKQDPSRTGRWFRRRRQLVDEGDERLLSRSFYQVGRLLRQPETSLYLEPARAHALKLVPAQPLCLVLGADAPLLRVDDPAVVRFHVGRSMAMTRPEVALVSVLGLDRVQDLCAAIGLRAPVVSQRRVAQWRQMVGGGLEFRLRRCLDQLPLDHLNQLAAAAEMMSLRAGLIACGDLNLALDLAVQGDPMLARLDTDELVGSLSRFWARSGLAYRVAGAVA